MTYAEHSYAMNEMRIATVFDPETRRSLRFESAGAGWSPSGRSGWTAVRIPPKPRLTPGRGFPPGAWDGNMLTVTTTHIKAGHIQMNGVTISDETTVIEHFIRRGNYLTNITILKDPVVFDRAVHSQLDMGTRPDAQVRAVSLRAQRDRRRDSTTRERLSSHPAWPEHAAHEFAILYGPPVEAARGGAETMYPEYVQHIRTARIPPRKPGTSGASATNPAR